MVEEAILAMPMAMMTVRVRKPCSGVRKVPRKGREQRRGRGKKGDLVGEGEREGVGEAKW